MEVERKLAEQIRDEIPLRSHIERGVWQPEIRGSASFSTWLTVPHGRGRFLTTIVRAIERMDKMRLDSINRSIEEEGNHTWEGARWSICGIKRGVSSDEAPDDL